jgi:protein-S-isoprenylcysteine O-methyltransferase Ste14
MRKSAATAGSALFLVVAPGVNAVLIPWLITGWDTDRDMPLIVQILGVALVAAGLPVILGAFARFVTEGHGTPAPVAAPDTLVVGGLYRWVRNPMYVAVASVIAGQALLFGSLELLVWLAVFLAAVVSFVKLHEEPALSERFGASYDEYRRTVPGWYPRRPKRLQTS